MLSAALGTILLPSLSKCYASNNTAEYSRLLDWGLRLTIMLTLPATRNEAKMVLMIRLIWLMETPNTAGPICLMTRHMPASFQLKRMLGNMPIFFRNGTWNASCTKPATNTAQASAMIGGSQYGASHSAPPMKQRLSRIGAKAGTQNLL